LFTLSLVQGFYMSKGIVASRQRLRSLLWLLVARRTSGNESS